MSETRDNGRKLPPEALVLRGRPRSAIRFRRRLVIALAALLSAAVFGAAWLALEGVPARPRQEAPAETARKATPDGLLALPGSYDQIPKPVPTLGLSAARRPWPVRRRAGEGARPHHDRPASGSRGGCLPRRASPAGPAGAAGARVSASSSGSRTRAAMRRGGRRATVRRNREPARSGSAWSAARARSSTSRNLSTIGSRRRSITRMRSSGRPRLTR